MGGTGSSESSAVAVLHAVADPNDSDTQDRQCYKDARGIHVDYPEGPEPAG
jgi:hypothetical protein